MSWFGDGVGLGKSRFVLLLVGLFAFCLVLAGCGGDDDSATTAAETSNGSEEAAAELTPVRVGIQPVAESAPLYLGIEEGFFAEEGLELEPLLNPAGGAAILEQTIAGEVEIGFGQPTSLVLARSNGVDVQIIAPATVAGEGADDGPVRVVAGADSGIEGPEDLAGKRVAINALNNILHLTLVEALEQNGVDSSSVELVEVAFPDMPAALEQGDVDALFTVEPFVTIALGGGAVPVMNPYEEVHPGLATADYFAMGDWISENPDVVAGFRAAMERSNQFAIDNPDLVNEIVPTFTQLDPETIEAIRLPIIAAESSDDAYQIHIDLVEAHADAGDPVTLEELLAE